MKKASILLIDEHALFRTGMALVLAAGIEGVVTLEAGSLEYALRMTECEPDLVLFDLQLHSDHAMEGISSLECKWPAARIVIVSSLNFPEAAEKAVSRGAVGFISKTDGPEQLLRLVESLLEGQVLLANTNGSMDRRPPRLTRRQLEVLELLCQGLSNKMIGRQLNLSENTIRNHVQALLASLKVSSRSEAAFIARRHGLVY